MFSMLVFMCRDPGDSTSKVSCCVEPSYCFKTSDFDALAKVPQALTVVIMLLHKGLTHIHLPRKGAFW